MILQSNSASFDFSQPHCPCGALVFSSTSRRRPPPKQLLLTANFSRQNLRRKWGFTACAMSPNAPGPPMNIEKTRLVMKRFSTQLDAGGELSDESPPAQLRGGNNFTDFREDPFVDKLRTQLGVIHPIPSPPINRNIVGLFVFFFFVGVVFDKLWTSRKRSNAAAGDGGRRAWPQVPTSFSLFLEKDLQRKESV